MKYSARTSLSFLNNAPAAFLIHGDSRFHKQLKMNLILKKNPAFSGYPKKTIAEDVLLSGDLPLETLLQSDDLFSGPQLVVITDATDKIMKDFFLPPSHLPVFILAKDYLKPVSKLRQHFETAPNLLCIPCFDLTHEDLKPYIAHFFIQHQKHIDPTLIHRLAMFFESTPDTIEGELEKILLYAGEEAEISADLIKNILSTPHHPEVQDFAKAVLHMDRAKFFLYGQHLEKDTLIPAIRTLYGGLLKLHYIQNALSSGKTFDQAAATLSPPPFFKEKAALKNQVQLWPADKIGHTLEGLKNMEVKIKQGVPGSQEQLSMYLSQTLIQ